MKITITTWYDIENGEGDTRTLKAKTEAMTGEDNSLLPVFDLHEEKVGAIERKLLKSNE